jgi:hypothetical protein
MNFSQLIKTLVDYLDLGKRIATTIPGMVLAIGFILLFAQAPDFLQQGKLENSQALTKSAIDEKRKSLVSAQVEDAAVQSSLQEIKDVSDAYGASLKRDLDSYRTNTQETQLAKVRGDQAYLRNQLRPDYQGLQARHLQLVQNQDEIQKQIASLDKERADRESQITANKEFNALLNKAFTSLLLFGLFGFAIGTVLDPINKALFLQLVPELGDRLSPNTDRGLIKAITGHTLLKSARDRKKAHHGRTAQFYIGRGLLSQAEYDGLVSDYYRFSQISIGMILPVLILAFGIDHTIAAKAGHFAKAGILAIGFVFGYVLYRVGIRRYGEFQQNVFDLIDGREAELNRRDKLLAKDSVVLQLSELAAQLKDALANCGAVGGPGPSGTSGPGGIA